MKLEDKKLGEVFKIAFNDGKLINKKSSKIEKEHYECGVGRVKNITHFWSKAKIGKFEKRIEEIEKDLRKCFKRRVKKGEIESKHEEHFVSMLMEANHEVIELKAKIQFVREELIQYELYR